MRRDHDSWFERLCPTRPHHLAAPLFLIATASGCLDLASTFEPGLGTPGDGGSDLCPVDFTAATAGPGCDPVLPPSACPAGTMPHLGSATCAPVGWTACPAGFEADPSGWGCLDVQPTTLCAGPTREVLGARTCQPLGDCTAAFPPPDATLFVDASLATPDATHFQTLAAAVAAAPAGAVIAVAAGTYAEALTLPRSVTLVGRCAEQTLLVAPSPATGAAGLSVGPAVAAEVRGLTLRGHGSGGRVTGGGSLTLRACLVDANVSFGVSAVDPGSTLRLVDSVVRDTSALGANVGHGVEVERGGKAELTGAVVKGNRRYGVFVTGAGSSAALTDSIVRDNLATAGDFGGMGVAADPGSTVSLTRSAIVHNRHRGVRANQATLTLTDSVVRDTEAQLSGALGDGVTVFDARLSLVRSALVRNTTVGLFAQGATTTLEVRDAVIRQTRSAADQSCGLAASVGATLTMGTSALVDNDECGLALFQATAHVDGSLIGSTRQAQNVAARGVDVFSASCLELRDSAVTGNSTLGLAVIDSSADAGCAASVSRTVVSGTLPRDDGLLGRGVSVQNAELLLERSALLENREVALFISRAGSTVTARQSTLRGTTPEASGAYGHGLVARTGARVSLLDCDVRANTSIALAFSGATALLSGGLVSGSAIALHAQEGSTLAEVANATSLGAPGVVTVSSTTRFEGNQTRVGAGVVPLPSDLGR